MMDGTMDGKAGRIWLCKKHEGHVLGLIISEIVNGQMVDRLLLFRNAIRLGDLRGKTMIALPHVDVMGTPEGTMRDIQCSECDAKRTWWMDKKLAGMLFAPAMREARND